RDGRSGAVLYGCVALVLLGFSKRNPESMTRLSFEDLCEDPVAKFRMLFAELDLSYDDKVHAVHARLSAGGNDGAEEHPHGVVRPSARMAWRWRAEVSDADLATIRDVWERFDLPLYREPADWSRGEETRLS
ncbi:MAG: hypothetical protein ACREK2_07225, partial [Gemmatimonadota bacterium]